MGGLCARRYSGSEVSLFLESAMARVQGLGPGVAGEARRI
jgi:hypothetical protein